MSVKHTTFWGTIYTCDLCGDETEDPWIDDDGDDLCGNCAQHFIASFGYLMAIEQEQKMRKRKHEQPMMTEGIRV